MSDQRPMTLDEWMEQLPHYHPARRELSELRAKVSDAEKRELDARKRVHDALEQAQQERFLRDLTEEKLTDVELRDKAQRDALEEAKFALHHAERFDTDGEAYVRCVKAKDAVESALKKGTESVECDHKMPVILKGGLEICYRCGSSVKGTTTKPLPRCQHGFALARMDPPCGCRSAKEG